jgi:hypothetical protein
MAGKATPAGNPVAVAAGVAGTSGLAGAPVTIVPCADAMATDKTKVDAATVKNVLMGISSRAWPFRPAPIFPTQGGRFPLHGQPDACPSQTLIAG